MTQKEITFLLSQSAKQYRKSVLGLKNVYQDLRTHYNWKVKKAIANMPIRWREIRNTFPSNSLGAFQLSQNSGNFRWYIQWNGPFRFGPTGIWGCMVHFDRSERNVSFHLNKLLSRVPLFCILLTRTITKRALAWVGSVQPESQYRSIGYVEFPKLNFKPEFCSIESAHWVRRDS